MKKTFELLNTGIWTILILAITGFILFAMGRIPYCACGYIKLWHGVTMSSENSQHIFDFYTFSHIIHGFFFYWLFKKILKRFPWQVQFLLAVIVEAGWELLENSPLIIHRYRSTTISLDYYGDSILNSLSDIVAMVGGFVLAAKLPWKITVLLTIVMEVVVGYLIHDNLTLNIIMLLYPFPFIKQWQLGG